MKKDELGEYNESLRKILVSVIQERAGFLFELGLGDAQVFDEYFIFFYENEFKEQADFIKALIVYIREGGNKSFEETYLLKEKAEELLKYILGRTGS